MVANIAELVDFDSFTVMGFCQQGLFVYLLGSVK